MSHMSRLAFKTKLDLGHIPNLVLEILWSYNFCTPNAIDYYTFLNTSYAD